MIALDLSPRLSPVLALVAICPCGRAYTEGQWDGLELAGEHEARGCVLEARECACGELLVVECDDLGLGAAMAACTEG